MYLNNFLERIESMAINQTLVHLSTREQQKSEGSQSFYISEDTDP